jgi:hypothetical protein
MSAGGAFAAASAASEPHIGSGIATAIGWARPSQKKYNKLKYIFQ